QGGTLSGYYVYAYDASGNPIGQPISVSSSLQSQLSSMFKTGTQTFVLGVNRLPVTLASPITYPIAINFQNISGWTGQPSAAPTSASTAQTSTSASKPIASAQFTVDLSNLREINNIYGVGLMTAPYTMMYSTTTGVSQSVTFNDSAPAIFALNTSSL